MQRREVAFKAEVDEQRMVFAEVYVPNVPDTDNEFMTAETIREMAYKFMKDQNQRQIDVNHDNELVEGACVVESFIARKDDPLFIEGAWVVGIHVDNDDVWDQIKKGEINGFSMEALVTLQETELEIEIPPVIQGRTSKSDDGHEHEFFVTYDPEGNFVGGRTSFTDGHYHTIKHGTTTEEAEGHSHKFSFVEHIGV